PGADHGMHAAAAATAARQRRIERLLGKARRQLGVGELAATRFEYRFDLLLRGVELLAELAALLGRRRLERRLECSQFAGFAQVLRLRVLEQCRITRRREVGERPADDGIKVLHPRSPAGSVREACFDLTGDLGERGLVAYREIGQHLAVDLDVGALQARHEDAIAQAMLAHRSVDAGDPQRAEGTLLVAAIAVGILPRLHQRLLGDAVDVLAPAAKPLGLLEDLLVARARRDSTLDSWHGGSLGRVRQHRTHRRRVGRVDRAAPAHLALPFGGLLGEDVALVRAAALDAAGTADLEALRRAPFGLHLRHTSLSFRMTPGGPRRCG